MYDLTIFSIFRDSESYAHRYMKQVRRLAWSVGGKIRVVWLEGDSVDDTYNRLQEYMKLFNSEGIDVSLVKYSTGAPYYGSVSHPDRWIQLATCWNKCLSFFKKTRFAIAVESDLIWNYQIVPKLIEKIDDKHNVIYPMLFTYGAQDVYKTDIFYDIHGFSRSGIKFNGTEPYYKDDSVLVDEEDLLELTTGGGMIVTTGDTMKLGKFSTHDCIMRFKPGVRKFMHKHLRVYHPTPAHWEANIEQPV
jgi:hypothetical protein